MISIVEGKVELTPYRSLRECREFTNEDRVRLNNELAEYPYSQFLLSLFRRFSVPDIIIGRLPGIQSNWSWGGPPTEDSLGIVGNIADTSAKLFYNSPNTSNAESSQPRESRLTIYRYFPEESEFNSVRFYSEMVAIDRDKSQEGRPREALWFLTLLI